MSAGLDANRVLVWNTLDDAAAPNRPPAGSPPNKDPAGLMGPPKSEVFFSSGAGSYFLGSARGLPPKRPPEAGLNNAFPDCSGYAGLDPKRFPAGVSSFMPPKVPPAAGLNNVEVSFCSGCTGFGANKPPVGASGFFSP